MDRFPCLIGPFEPVESLVVYYPAKMSKHARDSLFIDPSHKHVAERA